MIEIPTGYRLAYWMLKKVDEDQTMDDADGYLTSRCSFCYGTRLTKTH